MSDLIERLREKAAQHAEACHWELHNCEEELTEAAAHITTLEAKLAVAREALELAANRLGKACVNAIASGQERYSGEYAQWCDAARAALKELDQ